MLEFFSFNILPVKGLEATEIPMYYDSPYYVTVYQVIEGSVSGIGALFADPEVGTVFSSLLHLKT